MPREGPRAALSGRCRPRADLKRLKRDLESRSGWYLPNRHSDSVCRASAKSGPPVRRRRQIFPSADTPIYNGPGCKTWLDLGVVAVLIALIAATLYFLEPRQPASVESSERPCSSTDRTASTAQGTCRSVSRR